MKINVGILFWTCCHTNQARILNDEDDGDEFIYFSEILERKNVGFGLLGIDEVLGPKCPDLWGLYVHYLLENFTNKTCKDGWKKFNDEDAEFLTSHLFEVGDLNTKISTL